MRYQLTNEFQQVKEKCGILQNLHNDAVVEFVTVRQESPKAGEGILLQPNEKMRFSLEEGQIAYMRNIRMKREKIPVVVTEANFRQPVPDGYRQITKLGIEAGKIVRVPIETTETFCMPAVEVLKFQPGTQDVIETACSFDNADAADFFIENISGEEAPRMVFDGAMQPKTHYETAVQSIGALGGGYLLESAAIDFSKFKKVEAVAVE